MKKFDHLSALNTLLDFDTTLMKEELYYPWYAQDPGFSIMITSWFVFITSVLILFFLYTDYGIPAFIIFLILSILLATALKRLIKAKKILARKQVLQHTLQLEEKEFMKAIQPFVPDDQQYIANKIINEKDFSTDEYTKITLSSKSQVVFNTEAFTNKIKELYADPTKTIEPPKLDKDAFDEFKFKVPDSAKKKYTDILNKSTFSESLEVSAKTKSAILKKAYDAANHAALGREILQIAPDKK